MEYPSFSVLMSLYIKEKAEYFDECMQSILNQTVMPSEIVIVYDGPISMELKQTVEKYIKEYPALINIIINEKNKGLGLALADGVPACKYELIARMDTDDVARKDRFEKQLFEFIKRHFFIFSILFLGIIIALLSLLSFYVSVRQGFSSENRILMTIYEMKYKIDSSNGRNLLYSIALNLLRKNWFWGLGWMNFSNYSGQSGISMVRNVHNIYIQVILECGVILGLIFVICMLLLLFKCLKKVKRNKISGAGCAMLLYLLLGGMTDNTIYYPYFWIIFEVSLYISSI